jgi:HlyD family secretion protein
MVPVRTPFTRPRLILAGIAIVIVVVAIVLWRALVPASVALITTPVQQGNLVRTITASGTVNPQNTILVGTQVSGTIATIDVDYNSIVRTGEVLATIDPTAFQASLQQAQAQLSQTQANAGVAAADAAGAQAGVSVQRATAVAAAQNVDIARANAAAQNDAIATAQSNVTKAQSALLLTQQTMASDASLLAQGFVAQNVVDADQANFAAGQSGLAGAQASLTQARAQAVASAGAANQAVAQSDSQAAQNIVAGSAAQASAGTAAAQADAIGIESAAVKTAKFNLANTTITSPVNGTVIARNISLGETVAASFSTPTLFTIAQDLTKMEIDLAVGEPDIGSVKAGAPVTFTVLAYPTTTFSGTVSQVRQDPTVVSNVVTYDTVVIVGNQNGLLRPGMTANAFVQTQVATDALIVPVDALDWQPSAATAAAYHIAPPASKTKSKAGSVYGRTMGAGATAVAAGSSGRLFVERDGKLVSVRVQILLTAATQAAVAPLGGGTLTASDAVVTGDSTAAPARAAATSAPAAPAFGQTGGGGAARAVH